MRKLALLQPSFSRSHELRCAAQWHTRQRCAERGGMLAPVWCCAQVRCLPLPIPVEHCHLPKT